jgi:CheY-like chemotaxis protein
MTAPLQHILCIDDEPDIIEIAGMCLETVGGFKVTLCTNSAEAVTLAKEAQPDLILLDVMMPVMDGPTTLKKIREDHSLDAIPVIFMTARVQPQEVKEYLGFGAIGVIEKPFDPMALSNQVLQLWKDFNAQK